MSILDFAPQLGADYLALGQEVLERVGFAEEAQRVAGMRENAAVPIEEVPSQ